MRNRRGTTLVEMLLVTLLLTAFVVQLGAIWNTADRNLRLMANRAILNREMRTARALILSDLTAASSLTVTQPCRFSLHYSDPSLSDIAYSSSQGMLVRTVSEGSRVIGAAKYLETANCALATDQSLTASWTFSRGNAKASLNLFQVFVSTS